MKDEVWQQAVKEELEAIEKNNTWKLVSLSDGKKIIGLKWIYKTKFNTDGSILKHKARIVAEGYSQLQGMDYDETFSPIARMETVMMLVVVAAHHKWEIR